MISWEDGKKRGPALLAGKAELPAPAPFQPPGEAPARRGLGGMMVTGTAPRL